jgi:hypothetical protein
MPSGNGPSQSVPIATEQVFREQWVSAAIKLGLRWLPRFQAGTPLEHNDLPEVISEFEDIEFFFLSINATEQAIRANAARLALSGALGSYGSVEVYIG